MQKIVRSLSCVLLALVLTLSMAVLPAITAHADEAFSHPTSGNPTENDNQYMEELKALGAGHIFSFDTADFVLPYGEHFGDKLVADAGAFQGKAAMLTAESRLKDPSDKALNMSASNSFIQITLLDEAMGETHINPVIKGEDLIADGSYHLYKLDDVVVHFFGLYKFLFLFSDWGFQVPSWGDRLECLANQKVDFYLSMKIDGDMSFEDTANLPVYYIDRIIVAGQCSESEITQTGTVDATCTQDGGITGTCSICGGDAIKYESGTMLDHAFTNYVTNEDGSQTAECDYGCGTTDVIDPPEPETEPAEETEAPNETEAADETEPADESATPDDNDASKGNPINVSTTVLIIISIINSFLLVAAILAVVKTGKKKISLILIAIAIVLMAAVIILLLTGAATGSNPNGDDTDPTGETSGISAETKPTTPALTKENSLNLNQMKVVLPAEPTDVERNAAQELVDYIEKMTGKVIRIIKEGSAVDKGIYVGNTEFAKANNVVYPATECGEGWAIKAVDGNLVLCGESVRGTLYAVYHLLEDALGVHWWTFTDEYVPSVEAALVWNEYDDSGAPAFEYRDIHPGAYISETSMFYVRNRLNWDFANSPTGYGGNERYGAPAFVHTFAYYLPDSLYNEHPEWYSLVDGQRITGGQMCMTNNDLAQYVTDKMLDYIDRDFAQCDRTGTARPRWYALVPNDYQNFCECEDCVAAIEKSGLSGYLLQFINKVAEAVAVEYPEVLIDTLAYQHYKTPPLDDTKPADNVVIRFAHDQMDVYHSISHENNKEMLEFVQAWKELSPDHNQFFYWDYLVTYQNASIATFMYKFPDHFQTLLASGVNGYFGEQENPINTDFWEMKMWLVAKMLEDPYQDFDVLVDTFLNGYYGVAAPYVREYLDLAEALVADSYTYTSPYNSDVSPHWLKLEDAIAADEIFNKAFEAAEGDEELLVRLRKARNCLDRAILGRFNYFEREAEKQGIDHALNELEICQRLVDSIHEQIELRGQYDYTITGGVNDYGWVAKYEDLLAKLQNAQ